MKHSILASVVRWVSTSPQYATLEQYLLRKVSTISLRMNRLFNSYVYEIIN